MKDEVLCYLKDLIKEPKCELVFSSGLQLLIAVILSAQCTDKRVNSVTKVLFSKYPTAQDIKDADIKDLENIIKPCGLFRTKAEHVKSACKDIVEKFNNIMPRDREQLESLSGVGRKTANVVLSNLYNDNVIAVDTHVLRVSNRLGFVDTKSPKVCEDALTQIFQDGLKDLHHRLVLFGRYYCTARNPKCFECKLKNICKYYKENNK